MARKPYRMGAGIKACRVRVGDVVLLCPVDEKSSWRVAKRLVDAVPVKVTMVVIVTLNGRRAYQLHGVTMPAGRRTVVTEPLHGINALKTPVARP